MDERNPDLAVTVDGSKRELPWLDTGLQLLVIDPEGRQSIWPVCRALMHIGRNQTSSPNDIILEGASKIADRQAMLQFRGGKLLFLNLVDACPATVNGKAVSFCEVQKQQEILLGGFRLRLVSSDEGLASLEGYTQPYRGRRWVVESEPVPIGRPGKRNNHVALEDETVSRAHATITRQDGIFWLSADSPTIPTFVNGHRIENAKALEDGDLLQFGDQMLRFRLNQRPSAGDLTSQLTTILFADIWNYNELAESRPPDEFIRQVSEFYEAADRIMESHQGQLTSYLGDALVAIFGKDGHLAQDPVRAVRAAQALVKGMDSLNQGWKAQGLPALEIGVAIHTGEMILSDVGMRGENELTAVGDEAKLAAHIEKLTQTCKARILLSQATATAIEGAVPVTSRGTHALPGRSAPMELFEADPG